jgi:uncharacterized protein YjiS (DUF1127 family)
MSFLNLFILAGKGFSAWRRRERAYAELMALDDRSLADIGILRLQICALDEDARKQTEFPMNNLTPDHPTLVATRQRTEAEFELKNPDAALAAIRRPTSLRSRIKRSHMGAQGRRPTGGPANTERKVDNAQSTKTG